MPQGDDMKSHIFLYNVLRNVIVYNKTMVYPYKCIYLISLMIKYKFMYILRYVKVIMKSFIIN